jgi:iron complex outermembrane receptor protein
LRVGADIWAVQINNTIQYLSDELVINDPVKYAANYRLMPATFTGSGAAPHALAIFLPQQNLGSSEKIGIDFEAQWRHPSEWGRWNLAAQATYLLRSRAKANADADFSSDMGRYDPLTGTVSPRLRMRVIGGVSQGDWSAQLILNHTSSYDDSPVTATLLADGTSSRVTRRVASFTTWDMQALYALGRQMDVRMGVRNLFNQHAPLSFSSTTQQVFGANTVYSNLWGRTLELGITVRF